MELSSINPLFIAIHLLKNAATFALFSGVLFAKYWATAASKVKESLASGVQASANNVNGEYI
ncbi:hypothetical protein D3C86_2236250 [compost metagenome]